MHSRIACASRRQEAGGAAVLDRTRVAWRALYVFESYGGLVAAMEWHREYQGGLSVE